MKANLKLSPFIVLFLTIFCNWNGSMIGDESDKDPGIVFYGELVDHYRTGTVTDILIGGKYEAIPVYQTISKEDRKNKQKIDPKQNKTLIDFKEIQSIELRHPESPTKSEIELNGRNYVEIVVTSTHKNKKHYLIESFRKLKCKEEDKSADPASVTDMNGTTFEERELSFIHIKKLTIKGWKSEHDSSTKSVDEKVELKKNTSSLLTQIEENIKKLPKDNPSLLLQVKETLLSLLKSLREQLQKLVDMIH
jgi:hypothetical protein